jgi:hypothetical protein
MTTPINPSGDQYTQRAATAVLAAARAEHDFAGWLASIRASVASELGPSDAITVGRPGSWEAALIQQLVKHTAGHDDALLTDYGGPPR